MMKYKLESKGAKHYIREMSTNTVVKMVYSKKIAEDICRSLNKGSGFDGETPSFFTMKRDQKV